VKLNSAEDDARNDVVDKLNNISIFDGVTHDQDSSGNRLACGIIRLKLGGAVVVDNRIAGPGMLEDIGEHVVVGGKNRWACDKFLCQLGVFPDYKDRSWPTLRKHKLQAIKSQMMVLASQPMARDLLQRVQFRDKFISFHY
jgi:hypothetical protein